MTQIHLEQETVKVNNIFCIGRNYVDHIAELKNETPTEPVVFMKPNNSIIESGQTLTLPAYSQSVHYECELVLLIGQDADSINQTDPLSIISGYGVGLDLTARDIQSRLKEKGLPWTKAKGFRGAAALSRFVEADKLADPNDCVFTFKINGELRQQGQTSHMIYPLSHILKELSETYGLRKGDIVFTGTPAGVGELNTGDKLELDLAGIVKADFLVG
ncbi:hypothetical protein PL75_01380 [Neisseria arctica]|uniref:Fumarylacetoacetase-like C-terminal domain-containing protein n=1 Tax=Neisseria arctica TaxID=1470200 RepID=A0A0J0YU25_9NEIS|nr:fumarylacetoacetate hydrolase family protein [Neisseria arctica]KLT73627.1 hypothetical protein PL75_01380 [Neisseria arctica]UOO85753.1 fumarylacetoacetate hydrolase family protein [Neisseria arctica]